MRNRVPNVFEDRRRGYRGSVGDAFSHDHIRRQYLERRRDESGTNIRWRLNMRVMGNKTTHRDRKKFEYTCPYSWDMRFEEKSVSTPRRKCYDLQFLVLIYTLQKGYIAFVNQHQPPTPASRTQFQETKESMRMSHCTTFSRRKSTIRLYCYELPFVLSQWTSLPFFTLNWTGSSKAHARFFPLSHTTLPCKPAYEKEKFI